VRPASGKRTLHYCMQQSIRFVAGRDVSWKHVQKPYFCPDTTRTVRQFTSVYTLLAIDRCRNGNRVLLQSAL